MNVLKGFRPELLLFAAFFAIMPFSSSSYTVFRLSSETSDLVLGPFATIVLVAGLVAGLGAGLLAARGKEGLLLRRGAVCGGAALLVVGYGMFVALLLTGLATPLTVVAAVCAGVGGLELCIAWGALMASFGLRRAIFWVGLTAAGGSFVDLMLSSVDTTIAVLVFALMVLASVTVPCLQALRGEIADPTESGASSTPVERVGERRREGESLLQLVRRMGTVLFVPFAGLMVFAFVTGVRKFVLFDVVYMEALGIVIGAAVAIPLALMVRTRRPLLPFIYQVVLPVSALGLIVLNSFPEATSPLWLAAWLSYGFFGLIAILALASLCAMAHAGEFPAALVYGGAVAGFCAFSLLGQFCGTLPPFLEQNGGPALLVVSTLYFAFLIGMALGDGWRIQERAEAASDSEGDGDSTGDAEAHHAASLAARCHECAQERGLSPRETEILGFLARGHSPAFIAKTLVISESTARTHTKSIYRKLGVNSREELLEYIDS